MLSPFLLNSSSHVLIFNSWCHETLRKRHILELIKLLTFKLSCYYFSNSWQYIIFAVKVYIDDFTFNLLNNFQQLQVSKVQKL